ncbi:MAG TPA: hypothetical protein VFF04_02515 [Candidatus Babeliales bacterium]|nr:hypothetical protein [Candidatus Babeliales bacterium]
MRPTERTTLLRSSYKPSTERECAIITGVSAGCMCTVFAALYCCFGIPLAN